MGEEEFLLIAEKYKDTVFRIAFNYLSNSSDADDVVQDVLLKLYLTEKKFESEEHMRYWLIRITINQCKNLLKSFWWRKRTSLDEAVESITFQKKEQSELFTTVMTLPEKYRVVLYLFYYEEFSIKEIAELLHMKQSAVTTRLGRAREKLKNKLEEVFRYGIKSGIVY